MRALVRFIVAVTLVVACVTASHAASSEVKLEPAPIDPFDAASLQAGARTFVNYCLNCHSASMVRYSTLRHLGLTEQQIRENLLFTGEKVGDMMTVASRAADQRRWFGVVPPDLSLIARSRGTDWLYGYLRSFYRDPTTTTGWNNLVFPNVAMPHVLWQLQGIREAHAEVAKDAHGHEVKQIKLLAPEGGTLNSIEYDRTVSDLVNFMAWMSEPHHLERKRIGYYVLIGLGILILLTYALKAAYWKDVH